jgi:uncharacterized protein (TIGR00266 family)
MQTAIKGSKAFSYIEVSLEQGESIVCEAGGMSSMDAAIDLTARLNGGFLRALIKRYLGGETLFVSNFTNNTSQPRTLTLVQSVPGEIRCQKMQGEGFNLQPGAFIACTAGVKLGLRWAGLVSFIAREGLFKLVASGDGNLWYGAYGAMIEKEIDGEYIVDTAHLVAFEPGVKLKLQLAGGLFSSLFGGEGLVTRVEGKGKIIVQSRSLAGLAGWLNPKF